MAKRSGYRFIAKCRCNCSEQRIKAYDGGVITVCSHREPYVTYEDGRQEVLKDGS